MDTEGNLYNRYQDTDGQRKITPVGNVGDMKKFKISEVAGVKLDRDVNVVAFDDGRTLELPAGSGYVNEQGEVRGCGGRIAAAVLPVHASLTMSSVTAGAGGCNGC